jgi:hypothetical protein
LSRVNDWYEVEEKYVKRNATRFRTREATSLNQEWPEAAMIQHRSTGESEIQLEDIAHTEPQQIDPLQSDVREDQGPIAVSTQCHIEHCYMCTDAHVSTGNCSLRASDDVPAIVV